MNKPKTAITPTREENYPEWYQQVIAGRRPGRELAVRGCMVIKPWGYAIWENMQRALDGMFKATGPRERLLPAVHPAVVPRRRRPSTSRASRRSARSSRTIGSRRVPDGKLVPAGELEEPLDRAADVRDDHRRRVRELGAELSRPAAAHQPVGQRRALGDAHAAVPAHDRVPLAGGPHRARDARGGRRGDDADARRLRRRSPRTGWRCR